MHLSLCLYAPWNAGVGRTKRSKEPCQTLSRRPEGGGDGSGNARLGRTCSDGTVVQTTSLAVSSLSINQVLWHLQWCGCSISLEPASRRCVASTPVALGSRLFSAWQLSLFAWVCPVTPGCAERQTGNKVFMSHFTTFPLNTQKPI